VALGQSGPPASPKQVSYLQALIEKAGYANFREARRDFGLTQRQSGGKFTKQEASDLIDRIVNGDPEPTAELDSSGVLAVPEVTPAQAAMLRGIPGQILADELLSRGWSVRPPA
jgi:hypothetical protein